MQSAPRIVDNPYEVAARLWTIGGLTITMLHEVVEEGEVARGQATSNDAASAPGMYAYYGRVRALRDRVLPAWSKKCEHGSELAITPDKKHAVLFASGDENTGDKNEKPKTKCPKGIQMVAIAQANRDQLSLFAEDGTGTGEQEETSSVSEPKTRTTWVCLVARFEDRVTVELSTPVLLDDEGYVEEWGERLILPDINLNDLPTGRRTRTPEEGPDFDVEVTPRGA